MMDGAENGSNQRVKCMKYALMVINSFGVLLGFFIVLFGMSYPEEDFPGGYKGKETAMFAGVFIFFSLIGYCGASHQKIFFLAPYAVAIFFGMLYNFFNWFTSEEDCLDPKSLSLSGLLILLLCLASFLIYKIKKATTAATAVSMESMDKSSMRTTSSFVPIAKQQRK